MLLKKSLMRSVEPFDELLRAFFVPLFVLPYGRPDEFSNAPGMLDATDAQATHAVGVFSNGRQIWLARVFKFCTMAARWNSSRAPEKPRNRIRPKPWCVFRCAKRISTFLRSLRDLANSGVPIKARVASRASSCTSRGTFRKVMFGVHLGLSGHGARAINDSPAIVHRPGCPHKLTLTAYADLRLPLEGQVLALHVAS